jgi:HD-like signal output (HDOD) protein
MGLVQKIRRHAAIAGGNFDAMFKGVEIPPLPIAVQRLITEINKNNPDIDTLAKLISSSTGIATKVIKTVNSSYYSPRSPVTEIKQAVMFLGLKNIRSLVLAYAAMEAIPKPKGDLFDHEAFWIDSLVRAFLSRSFAATLYSKDHGEEAFTATLIADVALPVLLCVWDEYYAPIIKEWRHSPKQLSQLEREQFGWDHSQAGAWVVRSWGFPDELVCYIGAHNLTIAEIQKLELDDTIAVPIAIAELSASVLKQNPGHNHAMFAVALQVLDITAAEFSTLINTVQQSLNEVLDLFGLPDRGANDALDQLAGCVQTGSREC